MRKLVLFFVCLMLATPAFASDKFLDIQEVKTESGITAWLVEDQTLPILSVQFSFVGAGSVHDTIEKQGLTRLLSNTMDEGAGELSSQEFQKALSDHSITLRFNSSRDNFGGNVKTLTKHQDKAFELLKLALTQPRFDAEPLARMADANITRIKSSLSDPQWIAARIMNDRAYAGHPYALNSGGTISSLKAITADDLRNVIATRFSKDHLRIAVTGNITADTLRPILNDVFGHLRQSTDIAVPKNLNLQNTGSTILYDRDIPQSVVQMQYQSFGRDDPDFYALRVLNYRFGGGGFGSRLMEEIREKRGLTYGIYSSLLDMKYSDTVGISTSTANENVNEMLQLIDAEIQKLSVEGLTPEEIKTAQSYLTGSMPLALTSSDKIAGMLLSLQTQDLPIDYLDRYADNISSVTQSDVQRVIDRLFKDQKPVTVIVGKPKNYESTTTIEALPNVE